jgi:transcription elongation factor Elf1
VLAEITRERAERIARAHACERCREYSYKRLSVKPASAEHRAHFNEVWHAVAVCGICDLEQEIGIDEDGEIIYVS